MKHLFKFLNYKTIIIVLLIIHCIAFFISWESVNDFLNIKEQDYQNLLSLIISTTGTIFGIFFALIIFSSDLTKQRIGKQNLNILISKSKIIEIGVLLISTIISALFTKIYVLEIQTNNDLNLVYCSIWLFAATIIWILPFSIWFLKKISSDEFILDDIKEKTLTESYDQIIHTAYYYIKTGDYQNFIGVLKATNEKIKSESNQEVENLNKLTQLWDKIIEECIIYNRAHYIDEIWENYYTLHSYFSEKDFILNAILDCYQKTLIETYSERGIVTNIKKGLYYIFKDITILFENNDLNSYLDKQIDRIDQIMQLAIDHRNKNIFITYLQKSDFLLLKITELLEKNKLPNLRTNEFILSHRKQRLKYAYEFIKHGILINTRDLNNPLDNTINFREEPNSHQLMELYADFIYDSSCESKIDMTEIYSSWFSIFYLICKGFDNSDLNRKLVQVNVNCIVKIKDNIENKESLIDMTNYESLYTEFQSLKNNIKTIPDSYMMELIGDRIHSFEPLPKEKRFKIASPFA